MAEVGLATVTIVPVSKGAARQITKDLEGVDTSSVGKKIGTDLSTSIGRSMNMQSVGARISEIGSDIAGVGDRLTRGVTLPIVGATAAAGGLVAALGWKRLASIDTAQAQLKGLGYTAGDVDRITENLTVATTGGMMTMAEATFAAAGAMAAGVAEGDELTRYIKLLDSAVVGGTGSFDEMNQIFGRIVDTGKLTRTEFDMLAQRMPGFSSAVQKSMGISSEAMYEMLSAGEITSDQFLDVIEGFAGGMATEYAKTWDGMVQNTWAYVGILGQALMGGAFEQSKESIAELIDLLSSDAAAEWAAETGQKIGEAFATVVESIKSAVSWYQDLSPAMQGAIRNAALFTLALGPVLSVTGRVTRSVGAAVTAFGAFRLGISGAASAAKGAKGFAVLGSAMRGSYIYAGQFVDGLTSAGAAASAFAGPGARAGGVVANFGARFVQGARDSTVAASAFSGVAGTLGGAVSALGRPFSSFALGMRSSAAAASSFTGVAGTLGGALAGLGRAIAFTWVGRIASLFVIAAGALTAFFTKTETGQRIWASFVEAVKSVIDVVGPVLQSALQAAGDAMGRVFDAVMPVLASVGPAIASVFGVVVEAIGGFLSAAGDGLGRFIEGILPAVSAGVEAFGRVLSAVFEALVPVVDALLVAFQPIADELAPVFAEAGAEIGGAFGESLARMSEALAPLMEQITSSLVPAFTELVAAVSEIGAAFAEVWAQVAPLVAELVASLLPALMELVGVVAELAVQLVGALAPVLATVAELFSELVAAVVPILTELMGVAVELGAQLVSALFPVLTTLATLFGEIVAAIVPVIAEIVTALVPVIAQIVTVVGEVAAAILPLIAQLAATILPVIAQIIAAILPAIVSIIGAIVPLITMIVEILVPVITSILEVVTTVFEAIVPIIMGALEIITGIITVFTGLLTANWSQVWEGIKTIFAGVWNTVSSIVTGAMNIILSVITGVGQIISSVWSVVWNGIKAVLSPIITWLGSIIASVVKGVSAVWTSVWGGIVGFFSGTWNRIRGILENLRGGFSSVFNAVAGVVTGAFDGIVGTIRGAINGVIGLVNNAINAVNGINVDIPDWVPGLGGSSFGVSIPNIPYLAKGGLTMGPTLAMVGEGKYQEAVIPLSPKNLEVLAGGRDREPAPRQQGPLVNVYASENQDPVEIGNIAANEVSWQRKGGAL